MFLPFTGKWYNELITIPKQLKIFSFAVLLNMALSAYVFSKYTKPIVKRAYKNYREFKSTDMETLVALGCLSAFALCALFIIKYGL
jgi:cation transport ATPase